MLLSLATAQGHLPASLGLVKRGHLITGGMLGGTDARHLKCVTTKVAMLALQRAPCTMLRLRAHTPLASLKAGLWLDVIDLPP
jgi:hypothetical protein